MQFAFPELAQAPAAATLADPAWYRGLYAFHKYWGKKPAEPMRYLIQHLCPESGLVVDPFLGSGISALAAIQLNRRFVGKVADHPSAECKQLIGELVNFRNDLVTDIERNPGELIRWLYENQGDRQFDDLR